MAAGVIGVIWCLITFTKLFLKLPFKFASNFAQLFIFIKHNYFEAMQTLDETKT